MVGSACRPPLCVPRGSVGPRGGSCPPPSGSLALPRPVRVPVWCGTHSAVPLLTYVCCAAYQCASVTVPLASFPTGTSTACLWRPAFPYIAGGPLLGFLRLAWDRWSLARASQTHAVQGILGVHAGGLCPPGTRGHPGRQAVGCSPEPLANISG